MMIPHDSTFLKMSFDRKKRDVEAEKATADSKTTLLLPHRRKHLELDAEFEAQCKKRYDENYNFNMHTTSMSAMIPIASDRMQCVKSLVGIVAVKNWSGECFALNWKTMNF